VSCLVAQNYLPNNFFNSQKEFFISNTNTEQTVLAAIIALPAFSFPEIIPKNLFSFSGSDGGEATPDPRFKNILWFIIAGTKGGINRAKILNLIKDTPMNANKIATVLNLDHKTIAHHVKILAKNELVVKAEKDYGAEYELSQIMRENHMVLEEIMKKIGTK